MEFTGEHLAAIGVPMRVMACGGVVWRAVA
jgi:hypothetical protein